MELTDERWIERCHVLYPIPECVSHGVALDIGAHVGGFALAHHDRFERIICVEPCTETFKTLVQNTAHLGNVFCLNVALGRGHLAILRRHLAHPNDSASYSTRYHEEWGTGGGNVVQVVPTIGIHCLLDLCSAWGNGPTISFLKMDCEGAEYDAFDVHMGMMHENIEAIGIELHAQWPERREWVKQRLGELYNMHLHNFVNPHENIIYVRKL